MGLIERVEAWLRGWPESVLTAGLVLAALWLLYVAVAGSPLAKAAALAWSLAP